MLKALQRLVDSRLGTRTGKDVQNDLNSPYSLTKLALAIAMALKHNREQATELAKQQAKAQSLAAKFRDLLGLFGGFFELGIETIVLEKLAPKVIEVQAKINSVIARLDSSIKHNSQLLDQYNELRQQALQPWQQSQTNYINNVINGSGDQPGLKQQLPGSLEQSLQKAQAEQEQLKAQGQPHVEINTEALNMQKLSDKIVSEFAKEHSQKPTVLQAEGEYLQSMQAYDREHEVQKTQEAIKTMETQLEMLKDQKAQPKQISALETELATLNAKTYRNDIGLTEIRNTTSISAHNVMHTELRLQFLIREQLQKQVQMTGPNATRVANQISRDIMKAMRPNLNINQRIGELVKEYDVTGVKAYARGEIARRQVRDVYTQQVEFRSQLSTMQQDMSQANSNMAQVLQEAQVLLNRAQGLQAEIQYAPRAYNTPNPASTRPQPGSRVTDIPELKR